MARRHGRNGRLYMGITNSGSTPSPVAFLKSWSLEAKTDKSEVTAFGDSNKVKVAGLPDASGKFAGYWDDSTPQSWNAALDGNYRMFYLYPDVTNAPTVYWYGTAFFDFSVEVMVDGAITTQGGWDAAGAITKNG